MAIAPYGLMARRNFRGAGGMADRFMFMFININNVYVYVEINISRPFFLNELLLTVDRLLYCAAGQP